MKSIEIRRKKNLREALSPHHKFINVFPIPFRAIAAQILLLLNYDEALHTRLNVPVGSKVLMTIII